MEICYEAFGVSQTLYEYALFDLNRLTARAWKSSEFAIDLTPGSVRDLTEFSRLSQTPDRCPPRPADLPPHLEPIELKLSLRDGEMRLEEARFVDPDMERNAELLDPRAIAERRQVRGEPIKSAYGKRVTIIRAMDARLTHFRPMDYVVMLDALLSPAAAKRVKAHLDGEGESLLLTPHRPLLWTAEHAQTMAVSYGEPQRVIVARVPAVQVFAALNPGEFVYDGPLIEGATVLELDADGACRFPERPRASHEGLAL